MKNSNDIKYSRTAFGLLILMLITFVNGQSRKQNRVPVKQFETRCGWFDNPTPGNVWLNDKDGEWIIGIQGGHQVPGDGDWWPDFKPNQWVLTNAGSYGYGCACMKLRVNKETYEVLEVKSSTARPLAACRKDRLLKQRD